MCLRIDREWQGNWFPVKPGEPDPLLDIDNDIESSNSNSSNSNSTTSISTTSSFTRKKMMGITDPKCDDAEVLKHT